jgi:hypothetical protein
MTPPRTPPAPHVAAPASNQALNRMSTEPEPDAVTRPMGAVIALEPAVPPQFATSLFGYKRAHVESFVDDLRNRLATMRQRARRAENELRRLRALHAVSHEERGDALDLSQPGPDINKPRLRQAPTEAGGSD